MPNRKSLRQQLRAQRQSLDQTTQIMAATQLAAQVSKLPIFKASQHIAGYIANDNEANPAAILAIGRQQNKKCYLPVLNTNKQLDFIAYQPGDSLHKNRYQIPEPEFSTDKLIANTALDLVLIPLVGFDADGNRLGMGAGFYDRTFAFLQQNKRPTKPYLLGIAYEIQKIDQIIAETWDVRLDGIVTEKNFYEIKMANEIRA